MICSELVRGSIYSRKGGNRYDACWRTARFRVLVPTDQPTEPRLVCGIHVRKYNRANEGFWRNDDGLKRPRREPYYLVEALA